MSLFRRRKREHAHPHKVIGHLLAAGIDSVLTGTPEAAKEFAAHVAKDLSGLDAETLAGVAGILLIDRAAEEARVVQATTKRLIDAIRDQAEHLAEGIVVTDADEAREVVPTGDHGVTEQAQPEADEKPAKDWAEDRT